MKWGVFFLLIGHLSAICQTTIIGRLTKDHVVLAADSRMNYFNFRKTLDGKIFYDTLRFTVLKIKPVGNLFYAYAGNSDSTVENILHEAFKKFKTIPEVDKYIKASIAVRVDIALTRYDEQLLIERFYTKPIQILVAGYFDNQLILYGIQIDVDSKTIKTKTQGWGTAKYQKKESHEICGGHCDNIMRLYAADNDWQRLWKFGESAAINKIINIEIKADTFSVGPPIKILIIDKNEHRWIQ